MGKQLLKKTLVIDEREVTFDDIAIKGDRVVVKIQEESFEFTNLEFRSVFDPGLGKTHLLVGQRSHWVEKRDGIFKGETSLEGGDDRYEAPMPGKVIKIVVSEGKKVKKGAPLMILEAMKMEHTIRAKRDGIVQKIHCLCGDQVPVRASLLELGE
ncbi:MAG: hypothetical protein OXB88_07265 [Bacteriovoracales bacterium]|nr:hypothetical protein [Bacteriovoracales bacterium]